MICNGMRRPLPHALSHDMRLQVYNFFEKHLQNSDETVAEPEVKPETGRAALRGRYRKRSPGFRKQDATDPCA